jgi:hypothetical protein
MNRDTDPTPAARRALVTDRPSMPGAMRSITMASIERIIDRT